MTDSINKKENIFNDINFHDFWQKMTEAVKVGVEYYWENEILVNLFAINDFKNIRDEFFVRNNDFFSSQIRVDHHKPILLRLDKNFVNNFLTKTLESNNQIQELRQLTSLEIKILNNFCEYLYKQIQELLVPAKQLKLTAKSEKYINIIFLVSEEEDTCSQIVFSIPQDRINMVKLEHKKSFSDEDFINSAAFVKIRAGNTKLTLEELQNLSKDDIVLLEDSKANKLTLLSGNVEKDFKVEIDKSLILKIDSENENNEESGYEVKMDKNLWDDIQIELSAEFSKVKMTIGELKQITRGQIVDLGSVFDNEISLFIENKKVAKGELLIINDKYAVRLNEVLSSNVDKAAPAIKNDNKKEQNIPKQPQNPQQKQPQRQTVEDEEFDYSDFEK